MREGEGVAPSRPCARAWGRGGDLSDARTVPSARSFSCNTARRVSRGAALGSSPSSTTGASTFLGAISGRRGSDARTRTLPSAKTASARDHAPRGTIRDPPDARDESARPTQRPRGSKSRWEGSRFDFTPAGFLVQNDISHIVITAAKGITPFPLASREPSALFEALRVGDAARASILRDTPRGGRQRAARGPAARVVPHRDVRGRRRECRVVDAQPLDARRCHVRSFRRRATRGCARTARAGPSSARYPLRARLGVRGGHLVHRLWGLRVRGLVVAVSVVPVAAAEEAGTSVEAGGVERHESKGRGGMKYGGRERG